MIPATDCPIPCNLCDCAEFDELGDRDRDGRSLRTTICRRCGLVWSNPRPSEEEVRRYYSREYRLDYKRQATPSLRHIARSGRGALNRCRGLSPFLKPGDRVLDAGAGGGEVVYVLRTLGFDAEGLEPDEQYARHARETLGVPVGTGFVQDVSFPAGSFDAITMYHALEHVEDPVGILATLRRWIAVDGLLLVEVPNVEARCMAPAHRFHFAHFYNFNRVTLEATGRRPGSSPSRRQRPRTAATLSAFSKPPRRNRRARAVSEETTTAWPESFEATRLPDITCPRPRTRARWDDYGCICGIAPRPAGAKRHGKYSTNSQKQWMNAPFQ